MRIAICLLAVAGVCAARPARAQAPVVLAPQTRIRFRLPPDQPPIVGDVVVQRGDSVWVRQLGSAASVDFTLSSLVSLEVRSGTQRNAGKGALVGLIVGAVGGAALGAAASSRCPPGQQDWCFFPPEQTIPVTAAFGAGFGAGAGALIGVFVRTDRWLHVALPRGGTAALTRGGRAVVVRYTVF